MIDEIGPGAKLVWAQDEAGEIGKRPKMEPNLFEIDAERYIDSCRIVEERRRKRK